MENVSVIVPETNTDTFWRLACPLVVVAIIIIFFIEMSAPKPNLSVTKMIDTTVGFAVKAGPGPVILHNTAGDVDLWPRLITDITIVNDWNMFPMYQSTAKDIYYARTWYHTIILGCDADVLELWKEKYGTPPVIVFFDMASQQKIYHMVYASYSVIK